jgi:hypothetical protein
MRTMGLIIAIVSGSASALLFLLWVVGFGFAGAAIGNLIHILLVIALITGLFFVGGIVMFILGRKVSTK